MSESSLVLIEPDPFIGTGNTVAAYVPQYGGEDPDASFQENIARNRGFNLSDITNVSRPLNGIAVKPDTHAWVQVLKEDGTPILLFNALGEDLGLGRGAAESGSYGNSAVGGGGLGGIVKDNIPSISDVTSKEPDPLDYGDSGPNSAAWTDWLLQSVREQRVEKTQVVETFGDTYFYAFGERPRALEFTGLLMNTLDYNWRSIFWENWDRFFRATKLIEAGARMYIGWEDIIVEGYPINAAASETADSPNAMTFRFVFYITNYINTSSRSGFMSQKRARIARIRGGYIGGDATGKSSALKTTPFIGWIGPYGATFAGRKVTALSSGLGVDVSRFLGKTSASIADAAGKTAMALLTGPSVTSAFITNYYRHSVYSAAKFWSDYGIRKFEKARGFESGEVNAWFGFAGSIMSRVDKGSHAQEMELKGGSTASAPSGVNVNPNWLGKRAGLGTNMELALKSGSINSIIGSMAYAIPAMPGYQDNTVYSSPYGAGKPATATMVQMTPFEDMPASSSILPGLEPGINGEGGGGAVPGGNTLTSSDTGW
ncbi:MAG: hypothetical protein CL582_09655 [Alteromonadaceae bacterium]|nr:hypothetical protein [Alteromonadaceae bacterium]